MQGESKVIPGASEPRLSRVILVQEPTEACIGRPKAPPERIALPVETVQARRGTRSEQDNGLETLAYDQGVA